MQFTSPLVNKFISEILLKHSPTFTFKSKANPTGLYKVIEAFIKIFNKKINTSFVTVVNHTAWVPEDFENRSEENLLSVLFHETIHEYDLVKMGKIFELMYLFPQILCVLSILSIWFGWGWLLCLLFLLPLPSIGRMYIELRGYRANMLFLKYWLDYTDEQLKEAAQYYSKHFTNSDYYFMWPFKTHITSLLLKEKYNDKIYQELITFLKNNKN